VRFYKRIALIAGSGLLLWVGWYVVFSEGYEKYYGNKLSRLREIFMGSARYDVLFLGSSRTHRSIHPAIIDSITGRSSFNAGVEGGNLLEFLLTFQGYLIHHPPPNLLVLTIDVSSFNLDKKFVDYSEYYNVLDNRVVDSTLRANGLFTFIPKHFPPYRLINFDEITKRNAFRGLRGVQELEKDQVAYKGFLSNRYRCVDSTEAFPIQTVKIAKDALSYFTEIINECRARNIKVMLTYAPEYKFKLQSSFQNPHLAFSLLDSLCRKYSLLLYRDDSLPLCNVECLFFNYGHLNKQGAIVYSAIVAKRIRDMNIF